MKSKTLSDSVTLFPTILKFSSFKFIRAVAIATILPLSDKAGGNIFPILNLISLALKSVPATPKSFFKSCWKKANSVSILSVSDNLSIELSPKSFLPCSLIANGDTVV